MSLIIALCGGFLPLDSFLSLARMVCFLPYFILGFYAKKKGLMTTFDLIAPDSHTFALLTDLLPSVDYFMPSLEEAAFLSGRADPADAAAFFIDKGAGACVFKMGEQGSYTRTREGAFRTPAFKVPVSDTTGCGDAYCGGFVAALAADLDLERACRLGAATAALVATGLGSDAGVRDRRQVEAFIATAETLP